MSKDNKNSKGFTLTELLVTVVILGIIIGISIPLIKNIQANNENKKYDTYMESLLSGGKLYNDSYNEDLFGNQKNGCAYITYKELKEKKLIKDIQIDDITCDTDNTFVRVVKVGDKYSYKGFLGCGKDKNNITKIFPKRNDNEAYSIDNNLCSGIYGSSVTVTANPTSYQDEKGEYKWYNSNGKPIKVELKSFLGISKEDIEYTWVIKKDVNVYESITKANKVIFSIPNKETQKRYIENNEIEPFTIKSNDLEIPKNVEGYAYLKIDINSLSDLYEKNISDIYNSENDEGKTLYFGPYTIDNTNPEVEITNISTKNNNIKNTIISFKASDNVTPADQLRFCLTIQDKEVCEGKHSKLKKKEIEKIEDGIIYGKIEYDFSKLKDKNITIKVTAKDFADNMGISTKKSKAHTLVYKDTNECTNKIVYKVEGEETVWGTLCKPTKTGSSFDGWYTKKKGNGNLITKDTLVGSKEYLYVYPNWKESEIIFRFQTYDGEILTNQTNNNNDVYNWKTDTENGNYYYIYRSINNLPYELYNYRVKPSATSITLPRYNNPNELNITKGGLVATEGREWKCVSGCKNELTFKAGENNIKKGDLCDTSNGDCYVTLRVNWNENKVKIKLNVNNATVVNANNGYAVDQNSDVLKNGGKVIHEISYGGKLTNQGLLNYNNSSYLNVKKDGYIVPTGSEWNTKKDGTGISYDQTAIYNASDFCDASVSDCEVTLFLNLKKTYKVQYNLNGGRGTFPEQTKIKDIDLNLYINNPEKQGYNFKGWKATDGTIYNVGDIYKKNETTTLTAQWEKIVNTRYVYRFSENKWSLSGKMLYTSDSYESLINLTSWHTGAKYIHLKHLIDEDKNILETYVEMTVPPYTKTSNGSSSPARGKTFSIKYGTTTTDYNNNKQILDSIFGSCKATTSSGVSHYNCANKLTNISVEISSKGYVKGEISDDETCGYNYVCYINKNLGDNGNDQPIHSYCQKEPKCLVCSSYESGPVGRVPDNIVRHDNNNNTPNEYSRYVTVH